MAKDQSRWYSKDNILVFVLLFTFGIPIIPVGAVLAYSHFHPTQNSSSQSQPVAEPSKQSTYTDIHGTEDCTSDCSGHDAGYNWAEEHDICDTDYSNGNSESFNEGVRSWAEDNCQSQDSSSYDY